jgi:protein Mpv17
MLQKLGKLALPFSRWNSAVTRCRAVGKILFSKYLLVTNVAISTSLSGVGDTLQQHYEILTGDQPNLEWDKKRTLDMSITGATVGVVCHYWYIYLDKTLPGRTFKIVMKKLLVDQLFFSPFLIGIFFGTAGLLERAR